MKKIILSIFIFFICLKSTAQDNNICGKLYYTQIVNIGFSKIETTDYLMKFNSNESYSEEINIKSLNDHTETKEEIDNRGVLQKRKISMMARTNLTPKFFYNSQDEFYYLTILANEDILIKEDEYDWDWKLHNETKKIGGFMCQKATIDFRGHSYTAWFTNEISLPFGPWKFQGLPGLILEVYDTNKSFYVQTTKIEINSDDNCIININKEHLKEALTVAEFFEKRKEIFSKVSSMMRSRVPKGFKLQKTDKNCEGCPEGIEKYEENK